MYAIIIKDDRAASQWLITVEYIGGGNKSMHHYVRELVQNGVVKLTHHYVRERVQNGAVKLTHHYVRELVQNGVVKLTHVPTKEMAAEFLPKSLAVVMFM
eukprot:GHVS01066778.1.p1 GENE.GHVS01066778.1~~GHVS01066778.1.p1  ORF type:complete len:100 (-),score=13.51 GHVS01066778.1:476-775(-)